MNLFWKISQKSINTNEENKNYRWGLESPLHHNSYSIHHYNFYNIVFQMRSSICFTRMKRISYIWKSFHPHHPKTNFESSESHSKIVLQTFQLSKAQMQQLMKSYYIFWKLHKYSLRKYHRKGFPACYVLMLIQNQKSSSFEVIRSEVHFWYQCSRSKYQKARHVSDILYSACIF